MSLLNFRDPAPTVDPSGTRLRPGTLFRSAQPFPAADQATVALLRESGIRTVVDLRDPSEQLPEDWAAVLAAGVGVVAAPLNPAAPAVFDRLTAMRTDADLGTFYLALAEASPAAIAAAVRAAAHDGPVLLHCAAGKDRTGLLTALLLDLLGVAHERIATDYADTATALPAVFAALATRPHAAALNRDPADAPGGFTIPAPLLQAPPAAIRTFLDGIARQHGGSAAFLLACGAGPADLAAFRARATPAD
ncbi:tyrosine-protein phosphatase [Kitasatospora sp. LaBMicrA B282]|uniref:tyrosine-protein phosphatase n=1 Tax=Kitasatospora sp. LaBMicrA B282 TaxID=3420949 RepID=UPI003D0B4292